MTSTPATTPTQQTVPQPGAGWRLRAVVGTSVAASAAAAATTAVAWLVAEVDFLLLFAILRWIVVAALLVTPLLQQLLQQRWDVRLPYALRTPATALVLTVESICFDILSARL